MVAHPPRRAGRARARVLSRSTAVLYDQDPPHFHAGYAEHHAAIVIGSNEVLGHYKLRLGFSVQARRCADQPVERQHPGVRHS